MNPKKLVLVLVFIAAAIVALIRLNTQGETEPSTATSDGQESSQNAQTDFNQSALKNQQPTLLKGDFSDLKHIVLHQSTDLTMCKLVPAGDNRWNMLEPIEDRAEAGLADSLVNHLFDTDVAPVPEQWANRSHEDLGLVRPRLDIEVLYLNGNEERLQIGAEVPGTAYHFALAGEQLVLAPKQLTELIQRTPELWRDHGIIRWPHLIRRLEWAPFEGLGFVLERTGNHWQLLEPIQGAVDPMRMNSLLRMLGTRVSSLPGDRLSEESKAQFKQGASKLTLYNKTRNEDGASAQSFLVRNNFAMDTNRDYLLALSPGDFRFLQYTATELRSRRLENFDPNHISSIRLILNSEEVVLQRKRTGWANADGRKLSPAGQQQLTSLLRYLSILETKELAAPPESAQVQSILLSQAPKPVIRGSTQFRYRIMQNGKTAVAAAGSLQSYLAERNLDEEWAKVLVYEP